MRFTLKNPRSLQYIDYQNVRKTEFLGCQSQENSRDTGSFYTEDDARNAATQMNNYTTQMILPVMMMESDVRDHRARFY